VANKGKDVMASDECYFSHTSGGFVLYSAREGDTIPGCRFALCRYGEDPQLCLDQFWGEQASGDFQVVLLWSHGLCPRLPLTSQRSLAVALEVVSLERGSALEKQFKELCDRLNVRWPTRFQTAA
jgi:hypothetical protein